MQSVQVGDRAVTAGSVSLKLPRLKVEHGSAMLKGIPAKAPTFTDWLLLQVALFSIYL